MKKNIKLIGLQTKEKIAAMKLLETQDSDSVLTIEHDVKPKNRCESVHLLSRQA